MPPRFGAPTRILQILTYRTGYKQPLGERTYHTRIALTSLSTEAGAQMARVVFATQSLPEDLKAISG